jgi:hypothetical protein
MGTSIYSILFYCLFLSSHRTLRDIYYILGVVWLGFGCIDLLPLLDCGFEGIDGSFVREDKSGKERKKGSPERTYFIMNDDMRFRVCMAFTSLR